MSQDPATPYSALSTADTNQNLVKGKTAVLKGWALYNTNAAARFLKLYNQATVPVAGQGTPALRIMIPGNTAGAGSNIALPPTGVTLSLGLAYTITANSTDGDVSPIGGNEVYVNLFYD